MHFQCSGNYDAPVAVNIYSAATVSKLKMGEIAKAEIPFLVGYVGVFFLVCIFRMVLYVSHLRRFDYGTGSCDKGTDGKVENRFP